MVDVLCPPPPWRRWKPWRRRALSCGLEQIGVGLRLKTGLQRFQRSGVEEKGLESHEGYSVSVHPWPFVRVAGNHNLAEGIADMA